MSKFSRINDILSNELSKIAMLRSYLSPLNARYAQKVKGSSQEHRFLDGYPQRVLKRALRRLAFWQVAPVHFSGGMLLNLLGLQVLRFVYQNRIRPTGNIAPTFAPLRENGVLRVQQFLDNETLMAVRDFYRRNESLSTVYLQDFSELILYSNLPTIPDQHSHKREFADILTLLNKKLKFKRLFRELSGRELTVKPFVSVIHHKSFMDRNYAAQQDGNDTPHRDVFYPSYKIFIYLNDVTADNAAFTYYPGTHKMHERSLYDVYKSSLKYYFHDKWTSKPVNALSHYTVPPAPVSQTGNAGSAIFFNVAGIHQRGSYKKDMYRERIVLLVDFRQNDALWPQRQHRL